MQNPYKTENGILRVYYGDFTDVVIPKNTYIIGKEVFCGCFEMKTVKIPDSVVIIDDFAFRKCSGLTSIMLPPGLRYIGREAFAKCVWLEEITIPETVLGIGDRAFRKCRSLQKVNIIGHPDIGKDAFSKTPFSTTNVTH